MNEAACNETLATALREYGAAFRGDWSEIDGRAIRNQMDDVASAVAHGLDRTLTEWRDRLGVCPAGLGHWTCHCDDVCDSVTPVSSATEGGDNT